VCVDNVSHSGHGNYHCIVLQLNINLKKMNNMFISVNNVVRYCLSRRKGKNIHVVIMMDAVTSYLGFYFFFFCGFS
jgi:hypothetical protein